MGFLSHFCSRCGSPVSPRHPPYALSCWACYESLVLELELGWCQARDWRGNPYNAALCEQLNHLDCEWNMKAGSIDGGLRTRYTLVPTVSDLRSPVFFDALTFAGLGFSGLLFFFLPLPGVALGILFGISYVYIKDVHMRAEAYYSAKRRYQTQRQRLLLALKENLQPRNRAA